MATPVAPSFVPLLTLSEVADRLNVSVATVRRLVARGDLAAVRVGFVIRVPEADLLAFLVERRVA